MASRRPPTILYKRRRQQKTSYKKRLLLLKSGKPRLVFRFTNQKIIAQLVKFSGKGDLVVAAVDSFALKKEGWKYSCKNLPAAYLTGFLFGKMAIAKKHEEGILDTGLKSPLKKGRTFAFLQGVIDAGFKIPYTAEGLFPDEEKISGKHIENYADSKQFTQYLKNNSPPSQISQNFNQVKSKIQA